MAASTSDNISEVNISRNVATVIYKTYGAVAQIYSDNKTNHSSLLRILDEIRDQNKVIISLLCGLSGVSPSDIPEYDPGVSLKKPRLRKTKKDVSNIQKVSGQPAANLNNQPFTQSSTDVNSNSTSVKAEAPIVNTRASVRETVPDDNTGISVGQAAPVIDTRAAVRETVPADNTGISVGQIAPVIDTRAVDGIRETATVEIPYSYTNESFAESTQPPQRPVLSQGAAKRVGEINKVLASNTSPLMQLLDDTQYAPIDLKQTRGGIGDKTPPLCDSRSHTSIYTSCNIGGKCYLFPNRKRYSGTLSYNNYLSVLFDGIVDKNGDLVIEAVEYPAIISLGTTGYDVQTKGILRVRYE